MKKVIAILVALMLTLSVAYAEEMTGTWKLATVVIHGVTMTSDASGLESTIVFNEDGTFQLLTDIRGYIDEATVTIVEEDGAKYLYRDDNGKIGSTIELEDDFLVLAVGESEKMIYTREGKEDVSFEKPVAAGNISDFNGDYAVTYISGEGYTLAADVAMNQLAMYGLTTNEIKIAEGIVELMGAEGATYTFTEAGTLTKVSDEQNDVLDVVIYKLEDGGIAVCYLGITFYAQPVAVETAE